MYHPNTGRNIQHSYYEFFFPTLPNVVNPLEASTIKLIWKKEKAQLCAALTLEQNKIQISKSCKSCKDIKHQKQKKETKTF